MISADSVQDYSVCHHLNMLQQPGQACVVYKLSGSGHFELVNVM